MSQQSNQALRSRESIQRARQASASRPRQPNARIAMTVGIENARRFIKHHTDENSKDNTKLAYDSKQKEFIQFCDKVYANYPSNKKYHIDFEKVYHFLFYVSHRPTRRRGAKKNGEPQRTLFNLEEYESVQDQYQRPASEEMAPLPEDSVGWSCFTQYKCAVMQLHKDERDNEVTSLDWRTDIWRSPLQDLEKLVKKRKVIVAKQTHQEKMDTGFTFFNGLDVDKTVEKEFWDDGKRRYNLRDAFCAIRHRFIFLFTLCGVLRTETLRNAELSDLFTIRGQNPNKDPQPWDCLIMQILDGKTNKGGRFYGRSMRHLNVFMCALGALAFYLLCRFHLTKEFEGENCPDFTDNQAWYDIKLLIGFGTKNGEGTVPEGREKPMRSKPYYEAMKKVLGGLGLPANHYEHLGRVLGAANLQYMEIDDDIIRQLGNWSISVRDQCYSTKLPLKGMRAAAGMGDESTGQRYYNPRTLVEPPEELKKLIFPFADKALEEVTADVRRKGQRMGGNYLGAARCFLEMLIRMRTIILQDAAAMKVEHPRRCDGHIIFSAFPEIFRSQAFIDFTDKMKRHLSAVPQQVENTVESVLPGMKRHMNSMETAIRQNATNIEEMKTDLSDKMDVLLQHTSQDFLFGTLQQALLSMSSAVGGLRLGLADGGANGAAIAIAGTGVTQQQTSPAVAASPPTAIPDNVRLFRLHSTHCNLQGIWDEWHGVGSFDGVPIAGGVAALESKYKAKWRSQQKGIASRISRQNRICTAIKKKADQDGKTIRQVCTEWDEMYGSDCNGNMSRMVTMLQEKGFLPKKQSRGRGGLAQQQPEQPAPREREV